jgi:alpha-tubulin N-acetyltransferase 1
MLEEENTQPKKLGYDRPSEKFLNFLSKHYNLKDYIPQNNNFVVFMDYFISKDGGISKKEIDDKNSQIKKVDYINSKNRIISDKYYSKNEYKENEENNDKENEGEYSYLDKIYKFNNNKNINYKSDSIYIKKKIENINSKNSEFANEKKYIIKSNNNKISLDIDKKYDDLIENFNKIDISNNSINSFSNKNKIKNDYVANYKIHENQESFKNNPPWATSNSDNYISSSSSYGAHYSYRKK